MPIIQQQPIRRSLPHGRESFRQRNLGCIPQNMVFRGDNNLLHQPPNLNIDNCFVLKSQLRRYDTFAIQVSRNLEKGHLSLLNHVTCEIFIAEVSHAPLKKRNELWSISCHTFCRGFVKFWFNFILFQIIWFRQGSVWKSSVLKITRTHWNHFFHVHHWGRTRDCLEFEKRRRLKPVNLNRFENRFMRCQ